jgi:hypothetical protein
VARTGRLTYSRRGLSVHRNGLPENRVQVYPYDQRASDEPPEPDYPKESTLLKQRVSYGQRCLAGRQRIVGQNLGLVPQIPQKTNQQKCVHKPAVRRYAENVITIIQVKIGLVSGKRPVNLRYEQGGVFRGFNVGFKYFDHQLCGLKRE